MLVKKKKSESDWKKVYHKALIEALQPFGDVLEVGFDDYTADLIQTYHPKSHTIVEFNPEKAREWSKKYHHIHIVEGSWENALPKLGRFDAIFFHAELRTKKSKENPFLEDAVIALKEGKRLLSDIEKDLPELTKLLYSDHDLDALADQTPPSQYPNLARFLIELEANGQITKKQRSRLVEAKKLPKEKGKTVIEKFDEVQDSAFHFFEKCRAHHMKKGSRFTCFSDVPLSKYENPTFFEKIITNPILDFQEHWIDLPRPAPFPQALVIKIETLE